jgi:hypothetical protein
MPADATRMRSVDYGRVRYPSVVSTSLGKRELPLWPRRMVRLICGRAALHLFVGVRFGLRLRLRGTLALLLPDTVLLSHLSLQNSMPCGRARRNERGAKRSKDDAGGR